MTGWSISATLLLGIAAGPYGLHVLSPPVLSLLDPGIAMGLAMLGVFVGLSFDWRRRPTPGSLAASLVRTSTVMMPVAASAYAVLLYRDATIHPWWVLPVIVGAGAAVSEAVTDANADDVLMIGVAALVMAALREPSPPAMAFNIGALTVIALLVAAAGWLLVGQTDLEAEQHVFVVGSLLVMGGAAAYLGMSALLAGLIVGTAWNVARDVARTRITRDLYYFQHPLVVLVLMVAGAQATLSLHVFALGAVIIAVRAVARRTGGWIAARLWSTTGTRESLIAAGLIGIGIAVDLDRVSPGSELSGTIVGTVVIATIGANMIAALVAAPAAEASNGHADLTPQTGQ